MNVGCFGSIVCHDEKSQDCMRCGQLLACHDAAHGALMKVRKSLNVEHIVRSYEQTRIRRKIECPSELAHSGKRVKLTNYQSEIVNNDRFPVKARGMARRMFGKGIDGRFMRSALRQGVNPLKNSTPRIMSIGCDLLISGGFTKEQLINAIFDDFEINSCRKSAVSQSSTVIAAFVMMSVVDCANGRFILRGVS